MKDSVTPFSTLNFLINSLNYAAADMLDVFNLFCLLGILSFITIYYTLFQFVLNLLKSQSNKCTFTT